MTKKFIKSILALGLLLSTIQLPLKAEDQVQVMELDGHLKPQDFTLLEQADEVVYMTPELIEVLQHSSSSEKALQDLIAHLKAGYCVAPLKDVSLALEQALSALELESSSYVILKNYQQALLNGDALIKHAVTRKNKCTRFCTLFVQNQATIGCLEVRNDALVGGNIKFNTSGGEALNAQGAFESRMKAVRGTISLSSSDIALDPTAGPGAVLPVSNLPTALVVAGQGFTIGTITGAAFSSGIGGTSLGTHVFYYAVDVRIPITFTTPYTTNPTILLGLQNVNPSVNAGTAIVGATSATIAQVIVSNVSPSGAIINLVFNVEAEGAGYVNATAQAAAAVNEYISGSFNSLLVTLLADGPVA